MEIDREIVKGGSIAQIARDFGVGYDTLYEHSKKHVTRQLAQAYDKIQLTKDFDLLNTIDTILKRCEAIFERNFDKGHDTTALKALDSQRNTIDLLAKISYQLHQSKVAELQLLAERRGESSAQRRAEYEEKLNVLTTPELLLWERLNRKIWYNNNDIIRKERPINWEEVRRERQQWEEDYPENL